MTEKEIEKALDNYLFNEYQDFEDQTEFGDEHYQKIIKDEEFQKRLNDLIEYLHDNHSATGGSYTYNLLSLEELRGKR